MASAARVRLFSRGVLWRPREVRARQLTEGPIGSNGALGTPYLPMRVASNDKRILQVVLRRGRKTRSSSLTMIAWHAFAGLANNSTCGYGASTCIESALVWALSKGACLMRNFSSLTMHRPRAILLAAQQITGDRPDKFSTKQIQTRTQFIHAHKKRMGCLDQARGAFSLCAMRATRSEVDSSPNSHSSTRQDKVQGRSLPEHTCVQHCHYRRHCS